MNVKMTSPLQSNARFHGLGNQEFISKSTLLVSLSILVELLLIISGNCKHQKAQGPKDIMRHLVLIQYISLTQPKPTKKPAEIDATYRDPNSTVTSKNSLPIVPKKTCKSSWNSHRIQRVPVWYTCERMEDSKNL